MDFNEFAVKFPELSLYNKDPLGSQIVVPFNPNIGFVDPPVVAIEVTVNVPADTVFAVVKPWHVTFPVASEYKFAPLGSHIVVPFNPNNGFVDPPVVAIEELEIVVPVIVPTEVKLLECKFPALSEYNEVLGSAIE